MLNEELVLTVSGICFMVGSFRPQSPITIIGCETERQLLAGGMSPVWPDRKGK